MEDPGTGIYDADRVDNLGIYMPDIDGNKGANNLSKRADNLDGKVDNPGIGRRLEGNGRAEDPGTGVPNKNRVDNPGIYISNVDIDKEAHNLGRGVNDPSTSR